MPCDFKAVLTGSVFSAALADCDSASMIGCRCAGGRQQPDPDAGVEARHALLFHGRHIRHDRGALGLRHAERLEVAFLDLRRKRGRDVEHQRDAAGEQIDHRLIAAAGIMHRQDLRAGFEIEQFRGQVTGGAGAGRAEGEGVRLRLGERHEFAHIIGRHGRMRHQHIGHDAKERDRRKLFGEIEVRMGEDGIDGLGDRRHEQHIAVVGLRVTVASAAVMLLFPGRFSTTTGWPSFSSICLPTTRATMSALEPGPKPTRMRIGRVGYCSACADSRRQRRRNDESDKRNCAKSANHRRFPLDVS